jgi:hypothetical protein
VQPVGRRAAQASLYANVWSIELFWRRPAHFTYVQAKAVEMRENYIGTRTPDSADRSPRTPLSGGEAGEGPDKYGKD